MFVKLIHHSVQVCAINYSCSSVSVHCCRVSSVVKLCWNAVLWIYLWIY